MALSVAGVVFVTFAARRLIPVNATTAGFAYLLLVLVIASTWGFIEASLVSVLATISFNLFFLPPVGKLTIADPQNWIALFSLLATSLIASRLSTEARRRAQDAIERQQDVERLYTFSRAILLIEGGEPFAKRLAQKLAEIFALEAVALLDRRNSETYRAGPAELEGVEDQLRETALHGRSFSESERNRVVVAVRLGSEPIASLAMQGARMPDAVLQGIANLVAIGLERARAQELSHQIEAAKQSEQLRSTLIDAMAHEFKTPLTSISAATSSLLANPDMPPASKTELIKIADEEAHRLGELIEDSIDRARLDTEQIVLHAEAASLADLSRGVIASMQKELDDHPLAATLDDGLPLVPMDRRLIGLALKQLIDNARKYSPPGGQIAVSAFALGDAVAVEVTDAGPGIPAREQARVFERFYRSASVKNRIPGSGLGLSIAQRIARAHNGDLTVTSRPGETTFRLTLPAENEGDRN